MPSFDVTSKLDMPEVGNALDGMRREIEQRYDFKGSACKVEHDEKGITLTGDDDMKLRQLRELLQGYFSRRKLDIRALDYGKPEQASGNTLRQLVTLKQGIDREAAKAITRHVKDSKLKVQVQVQGDELRVTGKKRDDLQAAITEIKALGLELPLQFGNFRD